MTRDIKYKYKDKEYNVHITYKRIRKIYYRFKNGEFYVSSPLTFDSQILSGLHKHIDTLLKSANIFGGDNENGKLYYLGKEVKWNKDGGEILFSNGSSFKYFNYEDLIDRIKKCYFEVMISRTRYYEALMGIKKPYRIKFKKMKSRYGSNSVKTHTINYSEYLYMYSIDILDTLVVHELAHDIYRNHSKQFYELVYKYSPNYKKLNKKLKKGEYF